MPVKSAWHGAVQRKEVHDRPCSATKTTTTTMYGKKRSQRDVNSPEAVPMKIPDDKSATRLRSTRMTDDDDDYWRSTTRFMVGVVQGWWWYMRVQEDKGDKG